MNYSDHHLESQLRLLLNPIVSTPVPPRRRRNGGRTAPEIRVLELPVVMPATVPVPVEVFA